jgi:PAB1-binding protein PBP1
MATKIQLTNKSDEFNQWAKQFGVSSLFDYDKFENREFLKRLDEARPIYESKLKQNDSRNREN